MVPIFTIKKLDTDCFFEVTRMQSSIYSEVKSFQNSHDFFSKGVSYLWEEFSDEFMSNFMNDVQVDKSLSRMVEPKIGDRRRNYTHEIFGVINAISNYYYDQLHTVMISDTNVNLLSYGFDDYCLWRNIPKNIPGINIFAAINAVHDDLATLITEKLNSESVKLGERSAYVSYSFARQKEAICYDVFNDPVTVSFYNVNFKHYLSRGLNLKELDDMFRYFSFDQARVDVDRFKDIKTLNTSKRLPILKPKPETRITFLTMYGLSPSVRVSHLQMFIDMLTKGCLPFKSRTHEQIQKYIFSKFSSDSNSAIITHLERFLTIGKRHDDISTSNMLTIMALEHSCFAIRILPKFEFFDDVGTPASILDAVFAISYAVIFCCVAPSVFFQPDVCTRIIAGILKSLQSLSHVRRYLSGRWHNETVSIKDIPYDRKFMELPLMFSGATRVQILDDLVDIFSTILRLVREHKVAAHRNYSELYLIEPSAEGEYVPLMPSFAAQRSYESSEDCIVVVKYRAWLGSLMDVATKGNRLLGATVATAKTDDMRTAITRIGELIGYTIQGICLRMRVAVRMCMHHPLRIIPEWDWRHTTPNDSRVGVNLGFVVGENINEEFIVSEHYDRYIGMFEFVREMMNIPGIHDDSTSGILVDGFIIPPDMDYLVPAKTIIKQTFEALNDTSPFHRFLSAIPLGCAILNQEVRTTNNEIGTISAFYHHAFAAHLVQNNSAHFYLYRCLAGNISENDANLILDLLRPGGLRVSFRIHSIEPCMVGISRFTEKRNSRLTPGQVQVDNDLIHFMSAVITYAVPDFDSGHLSRLNIIKGVTIQKQIVHKLCSRAEEPPTPVGQRTVVLLESQAMISFQLLDNEYRYCIVCGDDIMTVADIINLQSKGRWLEIIFPAHFRVTHSQWIGFFKPILVSPCVRLVITESKIRVSRKVVQSYREIEVMEWNKKELDLVYQILSSGNNTLIEVPVFYDYTDLLDRAIRCQISDYEWYVNFGSDAFETNLMGKHLNVLREYYTTMKPLLSDDNWTKSDVSSREELFTYGQKNTSNEYKIIEGVPNYNNLIVTVHKDAVMTLDDLPILQSECTDDFILAYGCT